MSAIRRHAPLVVKEARALLLPWAAVVAAVACGVVLRGRIPSPLAVLAYVAGTIGLGALSIGHELSGGTLAPLLAQPVSRHRILFAKLAVLSLYLAVTLAVASVWVFSGESLHEFQGGSERVAALLLPVAGAVLVAPGLT